jgi:hypothetical protein
MARSPPQHLTLGKVPGITTHTSTLRIPEFEVVNKFLNQALTGLSIYGDWTIRYFRIDVQHQSPAGEGSDIAIGR